MSSVFFFWTISRFSLPLASKATTNISQSSVLLHVTTLWINNDKYGCTPLCPLGSPAKRQIYPLDHPQASLDPRRTPCDSAARKLSLGQPWGPSGQTFFWCCSAVLFHQNWTFSPVQHYSHYSTNKNMSWKCIDRDVNNNDICTPKAMTLVTSWSIRMADYTQAQFVLGSQTLDLAAYLDNDAHEEKDPIELGKIKDSKWFKHIQIHNI